MNYGKTFVIPDSLKECKVLKQPLIDEKPKMSTNKADLFKMIKERKRSIVDKYLGITTIPKTENK